MCCNIPKTGRKEKKREDQPGLSIPLDSAAVEKTCFPHTYTCSWELAGEVEAPVRVERVVRTPLHPTLYR